MWSCDVIRRMGLSDAAACRARRRDASAGCLAHQADKPLVDVDGTTTLGRSVVPSRSTMRC
jgi:hypothetical protein